MTGTDIDDEMLMAYADGELDEHDAARVEAVLSDDPSIVTRLAVFSRTREALVSAAAVRRADPLPGQVLSRAQVAIETAADLESDAKVVPLARPDRRLRFLPMSLAASLAVVGFLGGYVLSPYARVEPQDPRFAILGTTGLSEELDRLPAGGRAAIEGGEVAIIASFRDATGALCREFEVDSPDATTVVSVACRSQAGWDPKLAVVAPADDGTQYAPASSLETLDAYLAAIGASAPLPIEEEAAALDDLL
ncbi:anti-sigma factor [Silicimonas algicola]|uniref:Anti-sigma factor RsiW n=1 Tax=Silicimonas algicola TaxID=1826607 RepID=A0A316G5M3_9RHOB|nr:anti-sigma factor [Silicimonas algicola]AZQ68691.1 anti-sigma factor [Silicimonas algicola]PWK56239.1 anti-sigma factor RsiW [Silicimonas algicola]